MTTPDDLPPLTALRAFHAAGKLGSFQAAARALHVTPSAISHQVRGLEEWFGATLFVRGARRVELTKAGKALLRDTDLAFARIAKASKRVRVKGGRKLRVSTLPLFNGAWLIPRLHGFESRHPDISLEIETTNALSDFDRDVVDVAIRNQRVPTPGLASRKLLDIEGVPVCSASVAATLETPSDLARHTLIHVSARSGAWASWLKQVGLPDLEAKRNLSFDTVPASLEAAARGRGIALGMHPLMWEAPIARELVVPFAPKVAGISSYFVVHRKADAGRPEVRAFVDWLVKEMTAFRASRREIPRHAWRADD